MQVVERWILARLRDQTFLSLVELNEAIRVLLHELNHRPMRHLGQSRQVLFENLDKPALASLPTEPYEFAQWQKARVHPDYHVVFEKHYYSVPYRLIGQEVELRVTEKIVEIFHQRTRQASHPRTQTPGRYSTQSAHMPPAHQGYSEWSPERFVRWDREIGSHTAELVTTVLESRSHPQQAYRSCLGILSLSKRYTSERLEAACRRALSAGIRSYRGVCNILENKLDQLPTEPTQTPSLPSHPHIRGESYYQ